MSSVKYCDMIRASDHKFSYRLHLALYARTHGIRAAEREFQCSRNTVRMWLRRYNKGGRNAIAEQPRAPHSCPHKTTPADEQSVIEARRVTPCYGPQRLKDLWNLKPSPGAIARILRQAGLTTSRKKKRKKKNDLRAIKQRYAPFERIQADTKPLYDIDAFAPQMREAGLPCQQYTTIDVKSGALHVDYANELSTFYATLATKAMLERLGRAGVELAGVTLSTDNGSEYGGTERHMRTHGFPASIRKMEVNHRFLPPRTPNAHANVESSHAFIEWELFDLERFPTRDEFFRKVTTFQHYWNFARPNYSKGRKTPAQILEEEGVDPRVLLHPPIDLDRWLRNMTLTELSTPPGQGVGQNVPALPDKISRVPPRPPISPRLLFHSIHPILPVPPIPRRPAHGRRRKGLTGEISNF